MQVAYEWKLMEKRAYFPRLLTEKRAYFPRP